MDNKDELLQKILGYPRTSDRNVLRAGEENEIIQRFQKLWPRTNLLKCEGKT